jgi:predicted transcriptional regulator
MSEQQQQQQQQEQELNIDDLAGQLKELKDDQKEFKKENKDLFKRNTEFNKSVKAHSDRLRDIMAATGLETYEFDGMEFNIKCSTTEKHNLEELSGIMCDEDKYKAYMESVQSERVEVRTRNAKRVKTG